MNKKLVIQIIIIVAAFGGAGMVLYNGFFNNKGASVEVSTIGSDSGEKVLPYGETLDLTVLNSRPLQFNTISYPKLEPSQDVGIPESLLIAPLPTSAPQ